MYLGVVAKGIRKLKEKGEFVIMSCFTKNNKVSCFKDYLASTPCGDIYQAEADYFARCLLMPEAKFRELAEQGYTIEKLSTFFGMPKGQVCARFDDLGIEYNLDYRRPK